MRSILIFVVFIMVSASIQAQEPQYYRLKEDLKEVTLTPYHNNDMVIWKIQLIGSGVKRIFYLDTIHGFKVRVPEWLDLKETRKLNFFGGTLPPIEDVENAITVTSFDKSGFTDFQAFKNYIIEDPKYLEGVSPEWSGERHYLKDIEAMSIKKLDSYKVSLMFNDWPYMSNYVLAETNKAYLWINFAATPQTYDVNIGRFKKFLKTLELY